MNATTEKVYIKLADIGRREQDVLTVLSKIQGLKAAPEELINESPCYISEKVSRALAEKVKMYLEKAGATVEIEGDASDEGEERFFPLSEDEEEAILRSADYYTNPYEEDDEDAMAISAPPARTAYAASTVRASHDDVYAQRFTTVTEQEPLIRKKRTLSRKQAPKRPVWLSPALGIVLVLLLAGGGIWLVLSGYFANLSQQYDQSPTVGSVGTLEIDNPEQAELKLYHVIGTRVIQQVPFEGSKINLEQGDYYIEAQQGNQPAYFPVYIAGWGHRLTVEVVFPTKQIASEKVAYIPPGWFRMGNKETEVAYLGFPDEQPDVDVYVDGFFLSRFEVTNREFAEFVDAGGYHTEAYWERLIQDWPSLVNQVPSYGKVYGNDGWESAKKYIRSRFLDTDDRAAPRLWEADDPPYTYGHDDYPVFGISLYEADAYCRWMTLQTGKVHRLPTEAEWEKASRGYEGYFFSYGNEYDPERANTEAEGPKRVGSYPPNSYGLYDMTGNVWEWIGDHYRADAYQTWRDNYRKEIKNPRIFDETKRYDRVIVRGGSFRSVNRINARTPVRYPMFPNDWHTNIGFRYVVEL